MYLNDFDFLVYQEHYKELLQEADHERLIQAARLHNPRSRKLQLNIMNWLGTKLVSWGLNLQQSKPVVASACCNSCC